MPDELVSLPDVIHAGLPVVSTSSAYQAVCRGMVKVGLETVGLPDMRIERERLAGKRVTVGRESFSIDREGRKILREKLVEKVHPGQQTLV